MKKLLAAALAFCLGLILFACAAAEEAQFDIEALLIAAQAAETPDHAAALLLTAGLLDYPGTLPDEAVLAFEQALRRTALEATRQAEGALEADESLSPLFAIENDTMRVSYESLHGILQNQLDERSAAWLALLSLDETEPAAMADPTALAVRMQEWESFERAFDDFAETLHDIGHFSAGRSQALLSAYLLGSSDIPVYDHDLDTLTLREDLRESYEHFLAHRPHANSRYFAAIADAYELWQSNDWQHSDELMAQLAELVNAEHITPEYIDFDDDMDDHACEFC